MNYRQFDNIKCIVTRYEPVKSTETLKPGLGVIQGHWK